MLVSSIWISDNHKRGSAASISTSLCLSLLAHYPSHCCSVFDCVGVCACARARGRLLAFLLSVCMCVTVCGLRAVCMHCMCEERRGRVELLNLSTIWLICTDSRAHTHTRTHTYEIHGCFFSPLSGFTEESDTHCKLMNVGGLLLPKLPKMTTIVRAASHIFICQDAGNTFL